MSLKQYWVNNLGHLGNQINVVGLATLPQCATQPDTATHRMRRTASFSTRGLLLSGTFISDSADYNTEKC